MRVLLSAFACEPYAGSEPGNGWTWAEALSREHDVTVLTDGAHRERIEAELTVRPRSSLRFHYIGHGPGGYEGFSIYPYYYRWQRDALGVAEALHREHPFDVVHHATYGIHRVPSYLYKLGAPFIWGPIGGGEGVPVSFYAPRWIGKKEAAKEAVRAAWNALVPLDPRLRECARHATVLAVTTPDTLRAFPPDARRNAVVLPSSILNRADLETIAARRARPGSADGLSVAFVGRLNGWKGPTFALHAFARYARSFPAAQLHYYGDGPVRGLLEQLIAGYGLAGRVHLHGRVPRAELLTTLADHNAYLFPSLHDSSGFATLEAMAAGLPVVCLDVGGPGMSVPDGGGVKVRPDSPERAIAGLAVGLERLTTDPAFWASASEAARARALDPRATPTIEEMIARLYGAAGVLEPREATLA